MVKFVISLLEVNETQMERGLLEGCQLHGQFKFNDGCASASVGFKTMKAIMEGDDFATVVNDTSDNFPDGLEEANAMDAAAGLGEEDNDGQVSSVGSSPVSYTSWINSTRQFHLVGSAFSSFRASLSQDLRSSALMRAGPGDLLLHRQCTACSISASLGIPSSTWTGSRWMGMVGPGRFGFFV